MGLISAEFIRDVRRVMSANYIMGIVGLDVPPTFTDPVATRIYKAPEDLFGGPTLLELYNGG